MSDLRTYGGSKPRHDCDNLHLQTHIKRSLSFRSIPASTKGDQKLISRAKTDQSSKRTHTKQTEWKSILLHNYLFWSVKVNPSASNTRPIKY